MNPAAPPITLAPLPVDATSRICPPTPVLSVRFPPSNYSAPGNGVTPEGKLWVVTVATGFLFWYEGSTGEGCPGCGE